MLKEKSFYREGLPVRVTTARIEEYPIHFHEDIEVVYVLEGTIQLKNGYYLYTMKAGDIFILNDREIHSFYRTDDDNMVMMLQFDIGYFSKYCLNLKNSFFVTDMSDADEDEALETLRGILARIMMELLEKGADHERRIIENTHNLISCLMAEFQYFVMEDGRFVNESKKKENKILAGRMNRITDYMYENYARKLTLQEIADREHLSIYYLSHVIKEATGLNFQELLSFIRVEESEKLLLGSHKKIGKISEECGFSAVRYYIKYFTKWFGMPPDEYRKTFTGQVSSREIHARYTLCRPEEIREAVRNQDYNIYGDYSGGGASVIGTVALSLDAPAFQRESIARSESPLWEFMTRKNMRPATAAFRLLSDLEEKIIVAGSNYIISTPYIHNGRPGLSLLICNNGSAPDQPEVFFEEWTIAETLKAILCYEQKIDMLFRLSGFTGDCKIGRMKITRENMIAAWQSALGGERGMSRREMLLNQWDGLPIVSVTEQAAGGGLNVQVSMTGFECELVLIQQI